MISVSCLCYDPARSGTIVSGGMGRGAGSQGPSSTMSSPVLTLRLRTASSRYRTQSKSSPYFSTSRTVPGFPGDNVFLMCHVRWDFAMSSVDTMWQVLVILMDVGISVSSLRRKLWYETMFLSRKNSQRSGMQRDGVVYFLYSMRKSWHVVSDIIRLRAHYLTFFTAEDAESRREEQHKIRCSLRFSAISAVKKPDIRKNVRYWASSCLLLIFSRKISCFRKTPYDQDSFNITDTILDMFTEREYSEIQAWGVYQMVALLSGFLPEVSFSPRTTRESASFSQKITGQETNEDAARAGVLCDLAVLWASWFHAFSIHPCPLQCCWIKDYEPRRCGISVDNGTRPHTSWAP